MDGINALRLLKHGRMVSVRRDKKGSSAFDMFVVYRCENARGVNSEQLWFRYRSEWAWQRMTNPVEFWMKTDSVIEVVGD